MRTLALRKRLLGLFVMRESLAIPMSPVPRRTSVAGSGTLLPVPFGASFNGEEVALKSKDITSSLLLETRLLETSISLE
jgi:hypothetical protein